MTKCLRLGLAEGRHVLGPHEVAADQPEHAVHLGERDGGAGAAHRLGADLGAQRFKCFFSF